MFVIGTAGHVDHGKSTLVRAITGIDPDRLQEEKDRGMTIDLGFAWFSLPGGQEISIVDVPGHEKFVNNMLAGVGGIDLAMLVVAADEGVMPQTREHLAILDLLKVPGGLVAISKTDLVDDEWLELVKMDIYELTEGTVLEGSGVYPVSAEKGTGLEALTDAIDEMFTISVNRSDSGRPRLPVDRVFTVAGFGTVVTGTLLDGSLNSGQEIEMTPSGQKGRIRGLQTHKKKENVVHPGTRVAANISGIDQDHITRGEVLTVPGWLRPSEAFDVRLHVLDEAPNELSHNMFVTLHTGSGEGIARLRLLENDKAEPGFSYWAQLKPENPTPVVRGDYFVIRSNMTTLGGGVVVDTHAKRHRRKHAPTIKRLESLESDSTVDILLSTLESSGGSPLDSADIAEKSGVALTELHSELASLEEKDLIVDIGGGLYYSSLTLETTSTSIVSWLSEYHEKFPLRMGAKREELRSKLSLPNNPYNHLITFLTNREVIEGDSSVVRLYGYRPSLKPPQEKVVKFFLAKLGENPYSPPTNLEIEEEIVSFITEQGLVVRVGDGIVFTSSAYSHMLEVIRQHIDERGEITVGDVRDIFGTSRKYALALMDYMDHQQITRRVGDSRILR